MNIRKIFFPFILLFAINAKVFSQQQDAPFLYPTPPENLETLQERSSYFIEHFWDRCNLKSIFSSKKNFEQAFENYLSFMPYADSTVVFDSIERLIKEVKKTPANTITMGEIARTKLYSDSAQIQWDAVYIPFAKAAASARGIDNNQKAQYLKEISQLENTQVGMKLPSINMTLADGSSMNLNDVGASYILVFFDEPEDFENTMARVRMSTDYALNDLIGQGYVTVISLYPGAPDDNWKERVKDYPDNWIIAASTEADSKFDRRVKPTFYYTNKEHEILSKNLQADNLTEAFRVVLNNQQKIKAERERLRREALKNKEQPQ